MNRQQANLLILERLKQIVMERPDLRFHQLLFSEGIIRRDSEGQVIDDFYCESGALLLDLVDRENLEQS